MADTQTRTAARAAATHVVVLLATCNGARFLQAQLDSLLAQTHRDWSLIASDDASADDTMALLERFQTENPDRRITLIRGPGRGFTRNFLSLLYRSELAGNVVALCDQDDVWLPHKIERALSQMRGFDPETPVLYGGCSLVVTETLQDPRISPRIRRPPSFANALVQNIMGGNTMMLNPAALALVQAATDAPEMSHHDWWLYQLVAGGGGRVFFDREPGLLYRQHGANLIGANWGVQSKLGKIGYVLSGRYKRNNDLNLASLNSVSTLLSTKNQRLLQDFRRLRRETPHPRAIRRFYRAGIYRQTTIGNILMLLALLLRRI